MTKLFIALAVALVIVVLSFFIKPIIVSSDEETYNPEYHLDLTLSYNFSTTTMRATVPANACNTCLQNEQPSMCLTVCDIIID